MIGGKYILSDDGTPVACDDVIAWGRWIEANHELRRVALDEVGESQISTVFLGIDHAFCGGPPLLFETMVFGGALDGEQERYATREEALRGHAETVARVIRAVAH